MRRLVIAVLAASALAACGHGKDSSYRPGLPEKPLPSVSVFSDNPNSAEPSGDSACALLSKATQTRLLLGNAPTEYKDSNGGGAGDSGKMCSFTGNGAGAVVGYSCDATMARAQRQNLAAARLADDPARYGGATNGYVFKGNCLINIVGDPRSHDLAVMLDALAEAYAQNLP